MATKTRDGRAGALRILPAIALMLLAALDGCTSYKVADASKLTGNGLQGVAPYALASGSVSGTMWVLTDEGAAREMLGISPTRVGVVPVYARLENSGPRAIKLSVRDSFIVTDAGVGHRTLSVDEAVTRCRRDEGGPVLGAELLLGMPAAFMVGQHMSEVNRTLQKDYQHKEFRPTLLTPGAKAEGFLFFDVPARTQKSLQYVRLQVVDLETDESSLAILMLASGTPTAPTVSTTSTGAAQ